MWWREGQVMGSYQGIPIQSWSIGGRKRYQLELASQIMNFVNCFLLENVVGLSMLCQMEIWKITVNAMTTVTASQDSSQQKQWLFFNKELSVHSLSWCWRMYTSHHWIITLNGIERILEYVAIGLCFSNIISQKLLILLNLLPPMCKKTYGYRDNKWSGLLLFNWFLWCFLYHSPWCKEGAWKVVCFC